MKCQNRQFTKFISLLKFPGLQYCRHFFYAVRNMVSIVATKSCVEHFHRQWWSRTYCDEQQKLAYAPLSTCLPDIQVPSLTTRLSEIQGINNCVSWTGSYRYWSWRQGHAMENLKKCEQVLLYIVDEGYWKQVKLLDCQNAKISEGSVIYSLGTGSQQRSYSKEGISDRCWMQWPGTGPSIQNMLNLECLLTSCDVICLFRCLGN